MHQDGLTRWHDGFTSWEEVGAVMQDDWLRVDDEDGRLALEREGDELLVVEVDRQLRAAQRRALHRRGFRPLRALHVTTWRWNAQEAVLQVDLADYASTFERVAAAWGPERGPAKVRQLRTLQATRQLMIEQALQVLRNVFRSEPDALVIVVEQADDWWIDDDE